MKKVLLTLFLSLVVVISYGAPTYTLNEQWVNAGDGVKLLDPYYSDGVSFKWEGPSKGGKAHGTGTAIKYKNGEYESTYVGEYKNGIREGKGTFNHKDGSVKKGTFVNGQLVGHGTMESDNGDSYEGEFINYRIHGNGKARWGNGSTFEGFWVSDSPYTGMYTNYDGSVLYIEKGYPVEKISEKKSNYNPKIGSKLTEYFDQDWNRTDAKNATYYRIITYDSPHKPKGVVKDYYMNGKLQGESTFIYVDYDDEGKNFTEGTMTTYYPNGKLKSKGTFMNNKPNGPLLEYFDNGQIKSERFFTDGELDGSVINYYPNGNPYSVGKYDNGELKNNKYVQFTEDGEGAFLVYEEDFLKNRSAWDYSGVNGHSYVNPDNTITIEVTPDRSVSGGIYVGFDSNSSNIIEMSTRRNPNEKTVIGYLFGFKDWNNYCGLLLAGDQFTYIQIKNGKRMTDYDWQYCEAIQPDINKVTIANLGNSLSFEINGQELGTINRPRYDGGFYILTVENDGMKEAVVDAAGLSVFEIVQDTSQIAEYLPDQRRGSSDSWRGSGSGFFIDESGLIATNYHVIDGMDTIEVTFVRNGEPESYPASVVMSDKQNDLSILKIDSPQFSQMPSIPYNFTTNVKDTGSEVFTLGYPFADVMGEEVKFTDGKISAKSGIQGDITVYQISVPIQPGNSGGPLFDNQGNLVGITSSGLNRDYYKSENVNYAIKSSYLKNLVDNLPQSVVLQTNSNVADLPLVEKIKVFQPYMIFIKVK